MLRFIMSGLNKVSQGSFLLIYQLEKMQFCSRSHLNLQETIKNPAWLRPLDVSAEVIVNIILMNVSITSLLCFYIIKSESSLFQVCSHFCLSAC